MARISSICSAVNVVNPRPNMKQIAEKAEEHPDGLKIPTPLLPGRIYVGGGDMCYAPMTERHYLQVDIGISVDNPDRSHVEATFTVNFHQSDSEKFFREINSGSDELCSWLVCQRLESYSMIIAWVNIEEQIDNRWLCHGDYCLTTSIPIVDVGIKKSVSDAAGAAFRRLISRVYFNLLVIEETEDGKGEA